MAVDWKKPLMLRDGRFCRYGGERTGGDKWVEFWGPDWNGEEGWLKEVVTRDGVHVCYEGHAKLPDVLNQPPVDMEAPLYWLDNGDRAFVRERCLAETEGFKPGTVTSYKVDDPSGRLWLVLPDGQVQGLPPRVLANMTLAQQQAEGRAAIKRAQAQRAARREAEANAAIETTAGSLYGLF